MTGLNAIPQIAQIPGLQAAIDAKAPTASPTFSGTVGIPQPGGGANVRCYSFTTANWGIHDGSGGNGGIFFSDAGFTDMVAFNGGVGITSGQVFGWAAYPNSQAKDTGLERDAAGVVKFTNGGGTLRDWKARRGSLSEYLDVTEMTAPAAPAANTARLYAEDDGAGKTRLMVLFPSGAAQQLAIEP